MVCLSLKPGVPFSSGPSVTIYRSTLQSILEGLSLDHISECLFYLFFFVCVCVVLIHSFIPFFFSFFLPFLLFSFFLSFFRGRPIWKYSRFISILFLRADLFIPFFLFLSFFFLSFFLSFVAGLYGNILDLYQSYSYELIHLFLFSLSFFFLSFFFLSFFLPFFLSWQAYMEIFSIYINLIITS